MALVKNGLTMIKLEAIKEFEYNFWGNKVLVEVGDKHEWQESEAVELVKNGFCKYPGEPTPKETEEDSTDDSDEEKDDTEDEKEEDKKDSKKKKKKAKKSSRTK